MQELITFYIQSKRSEHSRVFIPLQTILLGKKKKTKNRNNVENFILRESCIYSAANIPKNYQLSNDCQSELFLIQFSSVQSLSHVQLFATPWTAACQASLSITNSWGLLKLMSIESVMPSSHLILYCPLLLLPSIFPSIRVFSNESDLHIRWPKYWSFSFSISASNEYSGLIPFRMDWLDLLAVQGTLKSPPTPQFKSINSPALSFLYSPNFTSIPDYWKNLSFDQTDLCWQSNVSAF